MHVKVTHTIKETYIGWRIGDGTEAFTGRSVFFRKKSPRFQFRYPFDTRHESCFVLAIITVIFIFSDAQNSEVKLISF